jgi:predicted CopG family antitoxin
LIKSLKQKKEKVESQSFSDIQRLSKGETRKKKELQIALRWRRPRDWSVSSREHHTLY